MKSTYKGQDYNCYIYSIRRKKKKLFKVREKKLDQSSEIPPGHEQNEVRDSR